MDIIIETDLGGDPDDFFAICYLISAGANIRLLNLAPGTTRQVAIARYIFQRLEMDVPIGVSEFGLVGKDKNDMHHKLLSSNNAKLLGEGDDKGDKLLERILEDYPNAQLFLIGPLVNMNNYLQNNQLNGNRVVMQGGFVGFDIHQVPCERISDFEGHTYYRTFNLDQCKEGGQRLLSTHAQRFFVGKNITHRIYYNSNIHSFLENKKLNEPMQLFMEASEFYFERKKKKKFHDPLAAVALMHPEIFTWIHGQLIHTYMGWGTHITEEGDYMAVDVNTDKFWEYIITGS